MNGEQRKALKSAIGLIHQAISAIEDIAEELRNAVLEGMEDDVRMDEYEDLECRAGDLDEITIALERYTR